MTPPPEWSMYVDGRYGNDTFDGKTWATAKKRPQAAIDAAVSGSTIYFADLHSALDNRMVINKPLAIVGMATARTVGNGPGFRPLLPTDTVIKVVAANVILRNILVETNALADFTGVGIDADHASGLTLENVTYFGREDADSNQQYGGTGIRVQNSERVGLTDVTCMNATVGFRIGAEASCGHAINYAGIQNYQDLVATDNGGGWHFMKCKFTNSGKPGDMTPVVWLGKLSGNHLFDAADWCEAGPNRVLIESDHNVFVRPISAPACEWHVKGNHNHFYGARTLGADWHFDGNYNRVDGGEWLSAIKGSGKRNRFSDVVGRALDYHGDKPYYDNSSFATVASKGTNVVGSLYKP